MSAGLTPYEFVKQVYYCQEKVLLDWQPDNDKYQEVLMEGNLVLQELEKAEDWLWLRQDQQLGYIPKFKDVKDQILRFPVPEGGMKPSRLYNDMIRLHKYHKTGVTDTSTPISAPVPTYTESVTRSTLLVPTRATDDPLEMRAADNPYAFEVCYRFSRNIGSPVTVRIPAGLVNNKYLFRVSSGCQVYGKIKWYVTVDGAIIEGWAWDDVEEQAEPVFGSATPWPSTDMPEYAIECTLPVGTREFSVGVELSFTDANLHPADTVIVSIPSHLFLPSDLPLTQQFIKSQVKQALDAVLPSDTTQYVRLCPSVYRRVPWLSAGYLHHDHTLQAHVDLPMINTNVVDLGAVLVQDEVVFTRPLMPGECDKIVMCDWQMPITKFTLGDYTDTYNHETRLLTEIPDPNYVVWQTAARHAQGSPPAADRAMELGQAAQRILSGMRQDNAEATMPDYIPRDYPWVFEVV